MRAGKRRQGLDAMREARMKEEPRVNDAGMFTRIL